MFQFTPKQHRSGRHKGDMDARQRMPAIRAVSSDELPVFQQRWWVEIDCGTAPLNEARVLEGNVVIGSLPYTVRRNKAGFKVGAMSTWTHISGPVLSQDLNEKRKAEVIRQLLTQLPRNISLHFVCRPSSTDAELIGKAFKAAGFEQDTQITYSQPDGAASILSHMNRKHAKHIISAGRRLEVIGIGAGEFIKFYEANLDEASKARYSYFDIAHDLIAEGTKRNPPQVRVIAARKRPERNNEDSVVANLGEDTLDAAVACAWDNERYYFWMRTHRPAGKSHPDAIKLLVVEAMEHARSLGLIFDADGVITVGSDWFFGRILKFQNIETRYVYGRRTALARLVKNYPPLEIAAWLIYSRFSMVKKLLMGRRRRRLLGHPSRCGRLAPVTGRRFSSEETWRSSSELVATPGGASQTVQNRSR
jgi:hypothetical protein